MARLPHGTVTFLFTDIEGSTRLLKELGPDRFGEILAEHARLLQDAFAAHDGEVVDTQGDSFFVAFRTAAHAVAAAVGAQRDLVAWEWPAGCAVRVRMGLHTGEPRVGEQRYVGIGVHRAARIGAAGHGGQVLLSSTTKELVEEDLPSGVSIRDLGERHLKDIDQPQHVYQLDVEGLRKQFAQLRTLDVERRRKRQRLYVGAALIGVIAAAVVIPIVTLGPGRSGGITVPGNAVAVIDPQSNKVTDAISVGARPGAISFGSGALWVANLDGQSVSRIDPATRSVTGTLPVVDTPTGLAAGAGAVWVVGSDPPHALVIVRRIDPQFDTVTKAIPVGNVLVGGGASAATFGNTVWIAPSDGLLTRLDAKTGRVLKRIDPHAGPTALAVGAGARWFADSFADTVTRVGGHGLVTPIQVGRGPSAIALGAGGVWVAEALDDKVVRIDPSTQSPTTTIPVGQAPEGIAVGAGAVWVANSGDGTVSRIDPASDKVTRTIPVGGSPQSVAIAAGRVWVTVDRQTTGNDQAAASGRILRLSTKDDVDYMDPALAYQTTSAQLIDATCAKLVNYPDKPAPAGTQLEPEVAQSLPTRSADGKTYTFTIRSGFRFSPPSNEPVTAETFKYTIERSLSRTMNGPARIYMHNVVGANAYMSGNAKHITGVKVRGNKLIIDLVRPEPDLVTLLAASFFCAVPTDTPLNSNGERTIPSAGPYYVKSYTPGQGVVLWQNPNYTGSRPHHFERIQMRVDVSQTTTDRQIEAGAVDYAIGSVDSPADAARLKSRYGPGSPAARSGRQQYFVNPTMDLEFIDLNTHRPLFRNARLRRAVNYAINRKALTGGGLSPSLDQPTDQYLPPGMPGYKPVNVYPLKSNLRAASLLAGNRHRTAHLYTCNVSPCRLDALVVKRDLARIRIHVVISQHPLNAFLGDLLAKPGAPFDLAFTPGFGADYPDPDDFLNTLLEHFPGYIPTFNDPAYRRKAEAASSLTGPRRYLAYGNLDAEATKKYAPLVPIGNDVIGDFFSARVGCQVYQPVYGMDLAAMCLRH